MPRAYFWANQSKNFGITNGVLWSLPSKSGRDLPDRLLLKEMKPGDVVFLYASQAIQAVAEVTSGWRPAHRPSGYPSAQGEGDDGWLVEAPTVHEGLSLSRHAARELVTWGLQGPFTVEGVPANKYVSRVSEADGAALLGALGLASFYDHDIPGVRADVLALLETDGVALGKFRREQQALRKYLLGGRSIAECDICAVSLPTSLLVAAHIVPRSHLTHDQRTDFFASAMLACSLGCDALFERGYLVVDAEGVLRSSVPADTPELGRLVDRLVGAGCAAHDEDRAAAFAVHRASWSSA